MQRESTGGTGSRPGAGASPWRRVARRRGLGPALIAAWRVVLVLRHLGRQSWLALRWLVRSREVTDFTYALTARNRGQLAAYLAEVAGAPLDDVLARMRELEEDMALRDHLSRVTADHPDRVFADAMPGYGRRLGWYVLVRLLRPRVIVESGVDKGLGACVLTAALVRNSAEGHPGFYYGLDVDPAAGWLLTGDYARHGWLLVGNSIESLKEIDEIDLFVQDSDHSALHEAREYETLESRLTEGALVLADNAHVTQELFEFARRTGRRFLYFAEEPEEHWYRGGGIGAAF